MAKVKGMFQRGRMWWLRYTPAPGAKQVRVSLDTEIEQVAAVKAVEILHRAPLEEVAEFEHELEEYLSESMRMRRLSQTFAPARRYVLKAFSAQMGVTRLSDLSVKVVERWVDFLKKGGGGKGSDGKPVKDGTVESYLFHLRAFCTWLVKKNKVRENVAAKVELGKVSRAVRKDFVSAETVRMLIENAPNDEMRFILYCGFHCGMRKLEIVEARPEWFQRGLNGRRGHVAIAKTPTFTPKDRDERVIPLSSEFNDFLGTVSMKGPFVLRPEKKHAKHKYRYDFRKPFTALMKEHRVKCTPHDMRRTFVSLKLIQDSSLIFKLAKWTGDHVTVLQDHYAHLLATDDDIETGL